MTQADQNSAMTLRDYWRVLWLRRRWVILVVVLCTLAAFGRAITQPKTYVATARLMYAPPANVASAAAGYSADLDRLSFEVQNVVNTVGSPAVRQRASSLLDASSGSVGYSVSATVAVPENKASGTAVSDVVDITAETGSPAASARIANAYAKAIIELRKEREQESWRAAQEIVQRQLDLYKTPESMLTADYAVLQQQLRNLQIAEASANGNFDIIVPATPPTSPASPQPMKSTALGLIVGLFAGVVLAFVVEQFDTRVRSYRTVADILGLPVIGRIPRLSRRAVHDGGLVACTDPEGSVSEALRVLRRNLEWSSIDGSLKTLIVTSLMKGEGKTLTLCNLAVTLARAGSKVILVDADLRNPQVHRVFNLPNQLGLTSAALGRVPLHDAVKEVSAVECSMPGVRTRGGAVLPAPLGGAWAGKLSIITSGPVPPNPGEVVASRSVAGALVELADSDIDYVLIDTPPLLGFGDAGSLAPSVDGILVTARVDTARRPVLEEGRDALAAMPGRKVGLVIVGERLDDTQYSTYSKYGSGQ